MADISASAYINAVTSGIAAGKASPSLGSAIATGITQGIDSGLAVAANFEKVQAMMTQNEINSDPAVIEAQKQQEIGRGQIVEAAGYEAQLKLEAMQANEESAYLTQVASLEAEKEKAVATRDDLVNMRELSTALNGTPEDINAALQNPKYSPTLLRNTDFALKFTAGAGARGADPMLVKTAQQQANAVNEARYREQWLQTIREGQERTQIKNQDEFDKDTSTIFTLSPEIKNAVMNNPDPNKPFDPTKLYVVKAGDVELDPTTKEPKMQPNKAPVPAGAINPFKDDNRYFSIYNGEILATYDEARGKVLSKSMETFQSGYNTYFRNKGGAPTLQGQQPSGGNLTSTGLDAGSEKELQSMSGEARPAPTLSPDALEGKTPEQQEEIKASFNEKVLQLSGVPRAERRVIRQVNANPLLTNEKPVVKALAAVESKGLNDATSPKGTYGLMQVTDKTFDTLQRRYPDILKPEYKNTPEGELLASKLYLRFLKGIFKDNELVFAAYNAGEGAVGNAFAAAKTKDWRGVKQELPKFVSAEKFKEVQDYPERVMKYMRYFNNG